MTPNRLEKALFIHGIVFCVLVLLLNPTHTLSHHVRSSRRMAAASDLHNVGLGLLSYDSTAGQLPTLAPPEPGGRPLHSWQTRVLPFLDQQDLFNQINLSLAWDDPRNATPLRKSIKLFTRSDEAGDPLPSGLAPSHDAGNSLILGSTKTFRAQHIPDGAATTLLVGEAKANFRAWGDPSNNREVRLGINKSPEGFGSSWISGSGCGKTGGANFLFADGSVRFLSDSIEPRVLQGLATPDAGDRVPPEY